MEHSPSQKLCTLAYENVCIVQEQLAVDEIEKISKKIQEENEERLAENMVAVITRHASLSPLSPLYHYHSQNIWSAGVGEGGLEEKNYPSSSCYFAKRMPQNVTSGSIDGLESEEICIRYHRPGNVMYRGPDGQLFPSPENHRKFSQKPDTLCPRETVLSFSPRFCRCWC